MSLESFNSVPLPAFDREISMEELLAGIDHEKLRGTLASLLGVPVCLLNEDEDLVLGYKPGPSCKRAPIHSDMEIIGYLETGEVDDATIESAVCLVELLLKNSERYLMASNLHLQAVNEDYEKLKKKHEALIASEGRYKELSESLERRVHEQVKTIELAQRQIYQSEKLASVGQLAAGVAHEINNPIGFMKSNLNTAQSYLEKLTVFSEKLVEENNERDLLCIWNEMELDYLIKDFHEMMEETIDGAVRIAKIVGDLKGFSNVDTSEEEVIDINQCVHRVCNIVSHKDEGHEVQIREFEDCPPVRCRSGEIGQALLNILLNAEQAIKGSGNIYVQTSCYGHGVCVAIVDTGVGMTHEVLDRAFEPFYTTHDVGGGVGLGLTVSRDIVQSHGGEISIESEVGTGTTVKVWLPVVGD